MTNDSIEAKALAMLNEVREERSYPLQATIYRIADADIEALCRAIEQHEAFKQEVGFALSNEWHNLHEGAKRNLDRFRIPLPKPDPLVDVAKSLGYFNTTAQHWAGDVREALDALGFEIREKWQ